MPLFPYLIAGGQRQLRINEGSRWGANLSGPRLCLRCQNVLPAVRWPRNLRQFFWGGSTCGWCGLETDKWGKMVADDRAV